MIYCLRFFIYFLLLLGTIPYKGYSQNPISLPENNLVSIKEDQNSYFLSNGIIEAKISKSSGSIISIKYFEKDLLAARGERPSAVWSHDASSSEMIHQITIDPNKNKGKRAEVSIKGISNGLPMGNGPGGSFIADIEIRYALAAGESGIYTYCIFDHKKDYPASSMGEARFVAFLNQDFDWISADDKRNKYYPLEKGGLDLNKYTFTANQHDNPAFGWINTKENIGFWLINASLEYMSGGPTKIDFLCHRDTKINGAPCVLNYWRSSHYGGSSVEVEHGEEWSKIIGPFMLFANKGSNQDKIREDAILQAKSEKKKWPYKWVNSPYYPLKEERGSISGKLILKDPLSSSDFLRLRIGVTAPDYGIGKSGSTTSRMVDWQFDAKHYQFWTEGNTNGEFTIKNIRPGKYTLHAFADGILGEFIKTDIIIKTGENINLKNLEWTPIRYGKQLWDIGIPNRNGSEFKGGDKFFENDILKKYPSFFPQDVNYTIGTSNFSEDWFYVQIPHVENPEMKEANQMPEASQKALIKSLGIDVLPEDQQKSAIKTITDLGLSGKYAKGRSTDWNINFHLKEELKGKTILRLAICGTGTSTITIKINDLPAGSIDNLRIDGTPNRSGSSGIWYERDLKFDAALLKKGQNTITLGVAAGQVVNGIMYDYIRLEHQ